MEPTTIYTIEMLKSGIKHYFLFVVLIERYNAVKSLVNSHSLISLGITYWIKPKDIISKENESVFTIHNYTFLLGTLFRLKFLMKFLIFAAITEDFMSTPSSLKFLVEHGFNFNQLFSKGIPYTRAKGV